MYDAPNGKEIVSLGKGKNGEKNRGFANAL